MRMKDDGTAGMVAGAGVDVQRDVEVECQGSYYARVCEGGVEYEAIICGDIGYVVSDRNDKIAGSDYAKSRYNCLDSPPGKHEADSRWGLKVAFSASLQYTTRQRAVSSR